MYRTNTEDTPVSQYYTTNYQPGARPRSAVLSVSQVRIHQRLRKGRLAGAESAGLNKVPHRSHRVQVVPAARQNRTAASSGLVHL